MELDFKDLFASARINSESFDGLLNELEIENGTTTHNFNNNELESQIISNKGARLLQSRSMNNKIKLDRADAICKEYQQNILSAERLQAEILSGMHEGMNIYVLFLKAMKIVSIQTGNNNLYQQAEENVKSVYGEGLQEPLAVEVELEEVKNRLGRLQSKLTDQQGNGWSMDKVKIAIASHKERIKYLENIKHKAS